MITSLYLHKVKSYIVKEEYYTNEGKPYKEVHIRIIDTDGQINNVYLYIDEEGK